MLSFKLPVKPAGKVAQGLSDGVFAVAGRLLARRAVARDLHGHAVFVIVAAAVTCLRAQLVEIPPLHSLQPVGDAVQRCILRGVIADALVRTLGVADPSFKGRAISL